MNLPAMNRETAEAVYDRLMATRRGDPVENTLARILTSWQLGQGAMPQWLGMGEDSVIAMMAHHFPAIDAYSLIPVRDQIDPQRTEELDDLRKLLMENRSGRSDSELWMLEIVIAGCMGSNHLWQDLGLWQRADLLRGEKRSVQDW
jgi:nitrogen fixation protein NifQ